MKICKRCAHCNADEAKFCVKCGERLVEQQMSEPQILIETLQCAKCGYNNKKGVKFCGNCGSSLAQDSKKIKRFFGWLLGLFGIVVLVSVFSINLPVKESTYLNVSYDEIEFAHNGLAENPEHSSNVLDPCWIDVDTDGTYDVIHPGWLKIKKMKKGFEVTCLPNIMREREREDSIKVVSGKFSSIIEVRQHEYSDETYLAVKFEDNYMTISAKGETRKVKLYTPSNKFNYRFLDGGVSRKTIDCNWIVVDMLQKNGEDEDNALVLHIKENNGDKRRAYLEVYNDGDHETLDIYQESGVIMPEYNRE